jgi:hypothetical protein
MADFASTIAQAYATSGAAVDLGRGVHEGAVAREAVVQVPLKMLNRHGLIAGATGTGKTKTLQGIAEQLSAAGVPVFVADIKGDVSGLADPGSTDANGPAEKRATDLGISYSPTGFPVEFLSLGGIGPGVPVRATVSDFGPQLLGKVLGANDVQEQSLSRSSRPTRARPSSQGSAASPRRPSACSCARSSVSRTAAAPSSSASRSSRSRTCCARRPTAAA